MLQRSRPARGQQTGRRTPPRPAATAAPRRHPATREAAATDRSDDRRDRVREHRRRRRRRHRINPDLHQQRREHHPHRLRPPGETAQPAPHRLHRPPHPAATVRAPAPAAFATSAAPITVTTSARRSSANTGSSTCERPHEPQRARRGRTAVPPAPQHPHPGPPPRPQRTTTTRARQLPADKPVLDPSSVHPYREHSASARYTALPDALGQERYREGLRMPSSARCRRQPTPHRHRHTPRSVGTHNARKPPPTSASPAPPNSGRTAAGYWAVTRSQQARAFFLDASRLYFLRSQRIR